MSNHLQANCDLAAAIIANMHAHIKGMPNGPERATLRSTVRRLDAELTKLTRQIA